MPELSFSRHSSEFSPQSSSSSAERFCSCHEEIRRHIRAQLRAGNLGRELETLSGFCPLPSEETRNLVRRSVDRKGTQRHRDLPTELGKENKWHQKPNATAAESSGKLRKMEWKEQQSHSSFRTETCKTSQKRTCAFPAERLSRRF